MLQQMYECHMNSVTVLKQRLVSWCVAQSAAECDWRGRQWVGKATKSVRACVQMENILNS